MDQKTQFMFTTIDHMKNVRDDDDNNQTEPIEETTPAPRMIFKTWLRVKLARWEIEIKRATQEAPPTGTVTA